MHFHLDSYTKRDRNKDIGITHLPRFKQADPTNWKRNIINKKQYEQPQCNHYQSYHKNESAGDHEYYCLNYLNSMNKVDTTTHKEQLYGKNRAHDIMYTVWADQYCRMTKQQ